MDVQEKIKIIWTDSGSIPLLLEVAEHEEFVNDPPLVEEFAPIDANGKPWWIHMCRLFSAGVVDFNDDGNIITTLRGRELIEATTVRRSGRVMSNDWSGPVPTLIH